MLRFITALLLTALGACLVGPAVAAEDKDVTALLDKAVKALGGEEKLSKVKAATWKGKGTITLQGSDNEITTRTTIRGIDHSRSEFEGEFGGNAVKGATVLAGDKGWRTFGENKAELNKEALANQKRNAYLAAVPITVLPLKTKAFKVEKADELKVGGKAAAGVKVTGPDGKDFKLYFDKESGLPVKLVAKVTGFMNEEFTLETTYGDYKEVGGIKKAMKIKATRDGEKFQELQISEFKTLDKVDPKTFAEPE